MATNADNGENGGDDNNHRIDYDKALQILEIELRSDVEEEIEIRDSTKSNCKIREEIFCRTPCAMEGAMQKDQWWLQFWFRLSLLVTFRERSHVLSSSIKAVLMEQKRQKTLGIHDSEAIVDSYLRNGAKASFNILVVNSQSCLFLFVVLKRKRI